MDNRQYSCFSVALAVIAFVISPAIDNDSSAVHAANRYRVASSSTSAGSDNYYSACGQGQHNVWFQEEMPLKVHIKEGGSSGKWTAKHSELVKKAFAEIASVSKGKLSFQFVSGKPYDIVCTNKPLNNPGQLTWEGAVTHKSTGPHHIEDATIVFHSDDKKFGDFTTFYEVALHEVGHAVGLGHSTDSSDIMYHKVSQHGTKTAFSVRDIKTLSMLYQYKPPASELDMVERHKIGKITGGNHTGLKVELPANKKSDYSKKLVALLQEKFSNSLKSVSGMGATTSSSCKFLVDRKGEVLDHSINKSSGNTQFDQSVLSTVTLSSPLPKVDGLRLAEVTEINLEFKGDGTVSDLDHSGAPPLELVASKPMTAVLASQKAPKLVALSPVAAGIDDPGSSKQPDSQDVPPATQTSQPPSVSPLGSTLAPDSAPEAVPPSHEAPSMLFDRQNRSNRSNQPDQYEPLEPSSFKIVTPAQAEAEANGGPPDLNQVESSQLSAPVLKPSSIIKAESDSKKSSSTRKNATEETSSDSTSDPSSSQTNLSLSDWQSEVRKIALTELDNLLLPEGCKIEILMRVKPDGNIDNITVKTSCGQIFIDQTAMRRCQNHEPYPKPPSNKDGISEVLVTFEKN